MFDPNQWFTDARDGKNYWAFRMPDGKTWMARNLNFETESGSWCYDNDEANCNIYGRLYDWETAQTVCPAGWRLPTDEDWQALINSVGGRETAGTKLKSQNGWRYNGNGTDDFGFSALPGGSRWGGIFYDVGLGGFWWTATEDGATLARYRDMDFNDEYVDSYWLDKSYGFSVRCVRDE